MSFSPLYPLYWLLFQFELENGSFIRLEGLVSLSSVASLYSCRSYQIRKASGSCKELIISSLCPFTESSFLFFIEAARFRAIELL